MPTPPGPPLEGAPAPERPPAAAESEPATPTNYNVRLTTLLVCAVIGLIIFATVYGRRTSEQEVDPEAVAQAEGIREETIERARPVTRVPGAPPPSSSAPLFSRTERPAPEAPGPSSADSAAAAEAAAAFSTGEVSPDVAAALRSYQEARNPYQRPGPSGAGAPTQEERRAELEAQRARQQAEQQRAQTLRDAATSSSSIRVSPPTFMDGPPGAAPFGAAPAEGELRGPSGTAPPQSLPGASGTFRGGPAPSAASFDANAATGAPVDASPEILSNGAKPTDDERFMANIQARQRRGTRLNQVQGPFPPFVLAKGTLIPIVVEQSASSELPGSIKMLTTAPVYDRTGQHVLVPAGAEILTDYGQPSAVGQKRLLVAATRMNLPDGRYLDFQDARATDPSGTAGLRDEVDRHLLSRFGAVGALAILGTAANVATDPYGFGGLGGLGAGGAADTTENGDIVIYPPTPGYGGGYGGGFPAQAGRSFAQEMNRVLGKLLDRAVDRQPTLRLRPGLRGRLLLGEDIDLAQPYYEGGTDMERIEKETRSYYRRVREEAQPPQRSSQRRRR